MYKRKIMVFSNTVPEDTHPQNTGFSRRNCSFQKLTTGETILMSCYQTTTAGIRASGRKAASSSSGNKKSILF
jgi:hypothetical protein